MIKSLWNFFFDRGVHTINPRLEYANDMLTRLYGPGSARAARDAEDAARAEKLANKAFYDGDQWKPGRVLEYRNDEELADILMHTRIRPDDEVRKVP